MKVNQRAVLLLLNLVATCEGFTLLVTKSSSQPGDLLTLKSSNYLSQLNQPFTIPDFSAPAPAAPAAAAPAPSGGDYLSQLNGAGPIVTPVESIQSTNSGDYLLQLNQNAAPITVQASGGDYLSQLAGAAVATSGAGAPSGTGGYLLQLGSNSTPSGSGAGPTCYLMSLGEQSGGFAVPNFVELEECPVAPPAYPAAAWGSAPANVTPVSNVQASGSGFSFQMGQEAAPVTVAANTGGYLSALGGSGTALSGSGSAGSTAGYLVQLKANATPSGSGTAGAGPCYLLSLNGNDAGFSVPQPVLVELDECDVVANATTGDYLSALNQPVATTPSYAAPAAAAPAAAAPAPSSGDYLSALGGPSTPSYAAPAAPAAYTPSFAGPAGGAPASTGDYLSSL